MAFGLDPNTATREIFTKSLTEVTLPADAHDLWLWYASNHQSLLRKLAEHPAMVPNLQQTYNTPANSKNKVYHMWDFVGRTLGYIFRLDPDLPDGFDEAMQDIFGRTAMSCNLILDTTPGALNKMIESTYPGEKGKEHPVFGEDILQLCRTMIDQDAYGESCKVCDRKKPKGGPEGLLKCAACKKTQYCSQKCQKIDWKRNNHKEKCKELQQGEASADALQK
jgi:hypothetical protein